MLETLTRRLENAHKGRRFFVRLCLAFLRSWQDADRTCTINRSTGRCDQLIKSDQ